MLTLVLKIVLLASSTVVFTRAMHPPKRAASQPDKVYKGQPFEHVVRFLAYLVWVAALPSIASAVLLAFYTHKPELVPLLCPASPDNIEPLEHISPRFLIGSILVLAGGSYRLWAFHQLGELFTYELTIKKKHSLVTSGPYAYVRHPSYTGVILLLIGQQLMQFGETGYAPYCGIVGTPFGLVVRSWPFIAVFGTLSLFRRCVVEDAQLKEKFGEVWVDYAAKVKWRLFPYLF
ncbi:ICMT-domain-containing protein [Cubamyces sp. BRFM 1775]|nr:ICMT-domain-containing protein [Cubamyces sp. BRFM 1775]